MNLISEKVKYFVLLFFFFFSFIEQLSKIKKKQTNKPPTKKNNTTTTKIKWERMLSIHLRRINLLEVELDLKTELNDLE